MDDKQDQSSKIARPHAHFETPHEVVVDPELSKEEKLEALDSLEQDARQLAVASSEGMSDGEATGLQQVLHAKEVLELPPIAIAYEVVLQDLQARLTDQGDGPLREAVQNVLAGIAEIRAGDKRGV